MSTSSTSSTSSGWNRSSTSSTPAPKKPSSLRGVFAGVVVVALAIGAMFLLVLL